MQIRVSIQFLEDGNDWPSLTTQTFLTWQVALKEGQKLIQKVRRGKKGRVISFLVEEVEK